MQMRIIRNNIRNQISVYLTCIIFQSVLVNKQRLAAPDTQNLQFGVLG